jgi:hypothetical protein
MPAEPAFSLTREDITVEAGEIAAPLPTMTVFTVPAAGGTSAVTWVAVVGM